MKRVLDLVWRGRIQIGDEPGIYSDAQYGGLCLDLPIELLPYAGTSKVPGDVAVIVEAEEVKIYEGFSGHPVSLFALVKRGGHWARKKLVTGELNSKNRGVAELRIRGAIPRYVTIRVETNPQLPPGLYDEMVIRRLSVKSDTHYGYLGFRFPNT
jgi:hypothetical protein